MEADFIEIISPPGAAPRRVRQGVSARDILPETDAHGEPFVCCLVNNEVLPLDTRLIFRATVEGLGARHPEGVRVMRRTACFLLAMAAGEAAPDAFFRIQHSVGDGFFFELNGADGAPAPIAAVAARMRALAAQDLPIINSICAYDEALAIFTAAGRADKLGLLEHVNTPAVRLQSCGGFTDLAQGPLAPSAGAASVFEIIPCGGGFVLQLPPEGGGGAAAAFAPRCGLMRAHREHMLWGRRVGLETVADLNAAVQSLGIAEIIQLCEALHARQFARLADGIAARSPAPSLLMLAGPSSAGKTTSAKRICVNLRNSGFHPVVISTDDYFSGDERTPRGEDGKPDYEHIGALDLEEFNAHMEALLAGRAIRRRTFDFKSKRPVMTDEELALSEGDILVIEGIHGLNPALGASVPRERKRLVFISALTQLGIDANTVLSTSDNRLIRRLVRDHLFRGSTALRTLGMWPSVRRGEERWIFPFQDNADESLNTALDYELAVLRPFAEPLLARVKPRDPEYAAARRLGRVLANFHPVSSSAVPPDSLLREYIGGGVFKY